MKRTKIVALATLVALVALIASQAVPQESKKESEFAFQQPTPEEMAAGMKRWQETMIPGKHHKRLEHLVGQWDTVTRMWMGGPGMPPSESKGSAEYSWLMDGRWMQHKFKGSMMGMPYEGFGIHGYDNYKKKYVTSWVDSMGTAMSTTSGSLDRTGNVLIEYGNMDEPMTGEIGKAVKMVSRFLSDDKHVFEIHDLGIGEENTMVLQITYTRKK